MILKIADWEFDIDMERTMEYSAAEAADHCDCAYCRNFYAAHDSVCPELRPTLAQFGLHVEAPDVLYPYDIEDRMYYNGDYVVFGSILKYGKERIKVGDVYLEAAEDPELEYPMPFFVLYVQELVIPWVLEEPMKDVISPANEPSFLKKMWEKLIGKTKSSKIKS